MGNESPLLPEPFSEKNIDGSPISREDEGRSLFRNPGNRDRRVAERRSGDRRSGTDRRIPGYDYVPITDRPAQMYRSEREYKAPERETAVYAAPPEYRAPEREAAAYTAPPVYKAPEPHISYDPERFDPPVDEKPGMIPNPMKMPPVKKKSSLEYDIDSDYGGYDSESAVSAGTSGDAPDMGGYGYDYDDESTGSTAGGSEYYGYDDPVRESTSEVGTGEDDYGYYDSRDTGSDDTSDDGMGAGSSYSSSETGGYDDDYGSSGDYDSDYGSDYESGSDLSSDYY